VKELLAAMKQSAMHITVEAASLAREAGSAKAYNIVMLGAASPYLGIEVSQLEKAIELFFARKGEDIVTMNLKAFRLGIDKRPE